MLKRTFTQKVIEQLKINHPELTDITVINELEFEATNNHSEEVICVNLENAYNHYI